MTAKTVTHESVYEDGALAPTKSGRKLCWHGETDHFDSAYDHLQEALAECRNDHPQATVTDLTCYRGLTIDADEPQYHWQLDAEEPAR